MANAGGLVISQWANAANTFAAAGTVTVSPALPAGQTGYPRVLRVSGSVSGVATVTFGASAAVSVPCNPNAPYSDVLLPPTAFPNPTGSVPVSVTADGAGVIRALIGFQ